jgi:hypothetical protein
VFRACCRHLEIAGVPNWIRTRTDSKRMDGHTLIGLDCWSNARLRRTVDPLVVERLWFCVVKTLHRGLLEPNLCELF